MCLADDRDQSKVVLRYVHSYFTDIGLLKGMVQRETDTGFELTNNVDITGFDEQLSQRPRAARSVRHLR